MEPIGAFPDAELWNSFGRSIFSIDELEFTLQNLGELQALNFGSHEDNMSICMAGGVEENFLYSLESLNSANLQYFSQENGVFLSIPSHENYCLSDSNNHIPATNDASTDGLLNNSDGFGGVDAGQQPSIVAPAKELQLRRKFEVPAEVPTAAPGGKINANSSKNSKKIPRDSSEVQKMKKKQKHTANGIDEDESIVNGGAQSSSSYCSEEENGSQEYSVETSNSKASAATLNSNGKTRASRGSATDPQSLYARKRREKINERLRILQNLVPNGTKVDISTMLDEAVHYVKFLQLQIKLLSSDEMWMYAPIAYNGMDISKKISTAL